MRRVREQTIELIEGVGLVVGEGRLPATVPNGSATSPRPNKGFSSVAIAL